MVQVPGSEPGFKRYSNGYILFLYHVNGKVKYNLQACSGKRLGGEAVRAGG
jgi:hypothetical protein